jgi:iron complex outermembrane recepter protein
MQFSVFDKYLRENNMKIKLPTILGAASVAITSIINFSQAAETEDVRQIEVIEVTALKRLQNLQKAPVSIDVLSSEKVEQAQIGSVEDISNITPGLTMDAFPKTQPRPYIRGIGSSDIGAGSDQSSAVYIDNVYMSRPGFLAFDSFDVERIEVVKGPQGTLWGKNVVGGLVHIINKKPTDFTEAKIKGTVGSEGTLNGNLMVNLPLIDETLFTRMVVNSSHHDGYGFNNNTGNELSDENNLTGRFQLLYNANDDLSVNLAVSTINEKNAGPARSLLDGQVQDLSIDPDGDVWLTSGEVDGFENREVTSFTANVEWNLDFGNLSVIANRKTLDLAFLEDLDGTNMLDFALSNNSSGDVLQIQRDGQEETKSNMLELRLASKEEGDLLWQVGYYFENTKIEQTNTDGLFAGLCFTDNAIGASGFYASGLATLVAQGLGFPSQSAVQYGQAISMSCSPDAELSTPAALQRFNQFGHVTSRAIFGEVTYDLSESYTLTVGSRYSKDEKEFSVDSNGSFLAFQLLANGYPFGYDQVTGKDTWDAFTYKITLDGDFSEDTFGYATVSTGYKSGGFQNNPLTPEQAVDSFNPERATNYEVGVKTHSFGDKLQLNAALFYMKQKDLQVHQLDGTISLTQNAGEASVKGLELETKFHATSSLTFDLKYNYLNAKFDEFIDRGINYSGNKLRMTPKNSFTLSAMYNWDNPFSSGGYLQLNGDINFKDKRFLDNSNQPPEILDETSVVNLQLMYSLENYQLSFWAKNITNESYKTHYAQVYNSYATYGAPRTFGVSASWYLE